MKFKEFYQIFENRESIRIKRKDGMFTAYIRGKIAGRLIVDTYSKPISIFKVVTNEPYKRMGVATALYNAAEDVYGELFPSKTVSDDALKFWQKRRPGIMDHDLRNYSEYLIGKEVSDREHRGIVREVGPKGVSALILGKNEGEVNSIFYTKNIKHLLPPDIYEKVYGSPVSEMTKPTFRPSKVYYK